MVQLLEGYERYRQASLPERVYRRDSYVSEEPIRQHGLQLAFRLEEGLEECTRGILGVRMDANRFRSRSSGGAARYFACLDLSFSKLCLVGITAPARFLSTSDSTILFPSTVAIAETHPLRSSIVAFISMAPSHPHLVRIPALARYTTYIPRHFPVNLSISTIDDGRFAMSFPRHPHPLTVEPVSSAGPSVFRSIRLKESAARRGLCIRTNGVRL